MKRFCITGLVVLSSVIGCVAQSVADVFLTMPDDLCPYLNTRQRLYLLEYAKAGTTDSVVNMFDVPSSVLEYKEDLLRLQIVDGIEYDLFLHADTLYFVQTACAPICHSVVKAYDKQWNLLRNIVPPIQATFVEAVIKDGQLQYIDRTPLLLDEEERKYYQP